MNFGAPVLAFSYTVRYFHDLVIKIASIYSTFTVVLVQKSYIMINVLVLNHKNMLIDVNDFKNHTNHKFSNLITSIVHINGHTCQCIH